MRFLFQLGLKRHSLVVGNAAQVRVVFRPSLAHNWRQSASIGQIDALAEECR